MMYLIIEETQYYDGLENNYHVEDCTDNYDKAVNMLQGYKLINKKKRQNIFYFKI
jgi:hypothetical protein